VNVRFRDAGYSNSVKSAGYIESEHNNQNSPNTFWTTGLWEDQDAGGGFQAAWAKNANKLLNWYN
jgi:hypothetical protein